MVQHLRFIRFVEQFVAAVSVEPMRDVVRKRRVSPPKAKPEPPTLRLIA